MEDYNNAKLVVGQLVLTYQRKVYRLEESGAVFNVGRHLVLTPLRRDRKQGWLAPVATGPEVWLPKEMCIGVDVADLDAPDLEKLWYERTAATRAALHEDLRRQKRERHDRLVAKGLRR